MTIQLLDVLSQALSPIAVQALSKSLGEPETNANKGLTAWLPTVLAGLASKATTGAGAASLFSTLTSSGVDVGVLGKFAAMLGSGPSGVHMVSDVGRNLLASTFGSDKIESLGPALGQLGGLKAGNGAALAALTVPLVFASLKRLIADHGLNASSTAALLIDQRQSLAGKIEPALASALGLGSPGTLLAGLATSASAGAAASAGMPRWLAPALAALAALLLLAYCTMRSGDKPADQAAAPVVTPAAPAAPASAVVTPAAFDLKAPAKVYFATGDAAVGDDGKQVLAAVAALMGKDSALQVDITGYTDKTGDAAANEDLAKRRAQAVRDALQAAGVAAERIGMKPPVFVEQGSGGADAESRRVDISAR